MAMINVIKYEGTNEVFVWKHPISSINMGSELIVRESQEAILLQDGRLVNVFGAGRHILETANLPGVKFVQKLVSFGKSMFIAEVYFVNLTEHMSLRWGTDSKIKYLDPVCRRS